MFRAFLVLATVSVVLLLTVGPGDLLGIHGGALVSSNRHKKAQAVTDRPAITVTSAPTSLGVNETGTVQVRATAPAAPGDTIVLDTAGTYGLGYYQVSDAVLDADLRATLTVTARSYTGSFKYYARIAATGTYQEGFSPTFVIAFARHAPRPQDNPTCGGETPKKADGTDWTCTYDDEFNGDGLDRSFWVPQTGGSTTGSGSTYACAVDSPDTISVADGHLDLSLVQLAAPRRCTRYKSSQYAFGQVMHYQTYSQTYGRYEIRAKVPDLDVPGVQESFWLWPQTNTYGGWPASGEIDFAEMYSVKSGLDRPYIHYLPGATTAGTNDNVTHNNCPINPGEFNTYGVEWSPGEITVLLNGEVCFTDDYSSAAANAQGQYSPFDQPFYLSLNQAMGASGNAYDPSVVPAKVTTQIDYVRIWK